MSVTSLPGLIFLHERKGRNKEREDEICVKKKRKERKSFFSPACKACHVLSLCAALLPSRNLYSERRKHCLYEVEKIFHFCLYLWSCVEYFGSDSFSECIFDLFNLPDFFLARRKSLWQLKGKYNLSFPEDLSAPVAGSSGGLCCQRTQQIWNLVLMLQQISL